MGFSGDIRSRADGLYQAMLGHPFVTGIGDGSLEVERFKHFIRQDYLYLVQYARTLALAAARAPTVEVMGRFALLAHETLNTEMALHRGYCARFGIGEAELEATKAAPTMQAYTDFPGAYRLRRLLRRAGLRPAALHVGLLRDRAGPAIAGQAGGPAALRRVDRYVLVGGVPDTGRLAPGPGG